METYAIFLYADGEIQWTTGDADGGVNGLGGNPAQVGVNLGDGMNFGVIPTSGSANIVDIESTSNVGENGVYIIKISDNPVVPDTSKKVTLIMHKNMDSIKSGTRALYIHFVQNSFSVY